MGESYEGKVVMVKGAASGISQGTAPGTSGYIAGRHIIMEPTQNAPLQYSDKRICIYCLAFGFMNTIRLDTIDKKSKEALFLD